MVDRHVREISEAASKAIDSLPDGQGVLGYSGGIDSAVMAKLLSGRGKKITSLTLGRSGSPDILAAAGAQFNVLSPTETLSKIVFVEEIEAAASKVADLVSVSNLAHYEDCLAFWLIGNAAKSVPGIGYVVSGNGPDEIFCGYDRFRRIVDSHGYEAGETEIIRALSNAEKLGKQVRVVLANFGLELFEPLLLESFRERCLKIPIKFKILRENDMLRKRVWRCFGRSLGIPESIVQRPKKAMQYGMNIHSLVWNMWKRGRLKLDFTEKKRP